MKYLIKKNMMSANYLVLLIAFNFVACTPEPEFELIAKKSNLCLTGKECEAAPVKMEAVTCEKGSACEANTVKNEVVSIIETEAACAKGSACDLAPVAVRPGVVTILLALGDIAQDKLVIAERSAQLIAQNAVKFASPVNNPKILVVKDSGHHGETIGDTQFIASKLLAAYKADVLDEPASGLRAQDLVGYDLVWFNNPGFPMGLASTLKVLKEFKGGVILSGDDMSYGAGFKTESLTGLKNIDNGSSVSCNGQTFNYDNNSAYKYQVTMEDKFLPGVDPSILSFEYGNDIDKTELLKLDSQYEVLAYASGAKNTCKFKHPVIVRYLK